MRLPGFIGIFNFCGPIFKCQRSSNTNALQGVTLEFELHAGTLYNQNMTQAARIFCNI